jgi:hypothetical protein
MGAARLPGEPGGTEALAAGDTTGAAAEPDAPAGQPAGVEDLAGAAGSRSRLVPVVVEPELVELGLVPPNRRVEVQVRLTNRSARQIRLGRPTAVALEGC